MKTRSNRLTGQRLVTTALAVGLLALAACGSDEPSADAPETVQDTGSDARGGDEVVMRLIAYKPRTLQVPAGTTVTWKQQDAGFHTVTSGSVAKDTSGSVKTNPDGTFDSGQLAKGKEFTHTFDEAGPYEYFCKIHPATMSGEVTVK